MRWKQTEVLYEKKLLLYMKFLMDTIDLDVVSFSRNWKQKHFRRETKYTQVKNLFFFILCKKLSWKNEISKDGVTILFSTKFTRTLWQKNNSGLLKLYTKITYFLQKVLWFFLIFSLLMSASVVLITCVMLEKTSIKHWRCYFCTQCLYPKWWLTKLCHDSP